MTRSRTFSPAAETTTPPRTFGPAAPRPSPPGPTSPASPWLHNRAYRRASLSPSRFPSICTWQVDGARSAAAHCQPHRGLEGAACLGWLFERLRVGVDIAAGDVERREGGFWILRQAAPPGLDQARLRTAALRRAAVPQHRSSA